MGQQEIDCFTKRRLARVRKREEVIKEEMAEPELPSRGLGIVEKKLFDVNTSIKSSLKLV